MELFIKGKLFFSFCILNKEPLHYSCKNAHSGLLEASKDYKTAVTSSPLCLYSNTKHMK